MITSQLLAIVSESLSNIVRHSKASRAVVGLTLGEGGQIAELWIEDNGVGFDPSGVGRLGHQGLANTRERAAEIGGSVVITSRPGSGARVVVVVPQGEQRSAS